MRRDGTNANAANANEYGQAVYFTLVKIEGANGWRDAVKAHPNVNRARGYAQAEAEHAARYGLRAEVRIYDASLVECVSVMDVTETKGGAE